MQKAIRRADAAVAGFFALELWTSGYRDYVWKRLFTISAEDCYGIVTGEIEALWQGHEVVNKKATEPKGRIFVSKAVLLLCECRKNRDADHLQNFIYDRKDVDIENGLRISDKAPYPFHLIHSMCIPAKARRRDARKPSFSGKSMKPCNRVFPACSMI